MRSDSAKPRRSSSAWRPPSPRAHTTAICCASQSLPLLDQMTQHRSAAPGQQQLGLSHARGSPRGQDDYADGERAVSNRLCHQAQVPPNSAPVARICAAPKEAFRLWLTQAEEVVGSAHRIGHGELAADYHRCIRRYPDPRDTVQAVGALQLVTWRSGGPIQLQV